MFHPKLLEHDTVGTSTEGGRLRNIIDQLNLAGLWNEVIHEADIAPMKRLRDIHDGEYLNELHKKSVCGASQLDEKTPLMGQSFEVSRYGAGGVLDAVDLVMTGVVSRAFCLTAMPGHHAGTASFGFGSLVNSAAAGAHYLTKKYSLKRILILDLDSEHGVGTQEIFYKRRDVLTISLHEYPGRTGTGHYTEVGEKASQGFNLNFPLPSGYGDREYNVCFKEIIDLIVGQFSPEFIILSFGTNPLSNDASSHLLMSDFGLLETISHVISLAQKYCGGRIISVLEGGTPGILMGLAVSQHAMLMVNNLRACVDRGKRDEIISYSDWFSYSKLLKTVMRKYWKL